MQHPPFSTIQTDYTKIQKGDWFFPMTIKGVDQHAFILEAVKNGAIGFTYQEGHSIPSVNVSNFKVSNLREYLFSLAILKRNQSQFKTTAITGSTGKTSVKELVGTILKAWLPSNSSYSPENLNTKIAIATQILRMPSDCRLAVFEMGARQVDDLAIPLKIIQPEVAVLLNIGTAHIGEFGSIENLIKEKLSILSSPAAKTLVVPHDDKYIYDFAINTEKNVLSFGRAENSDIRLVEETDFYVKLIYQDFEYTLDCPFISSAKGLNVAAAVATALVLDIPMETIRTALSGFNGIPRRFQIFQWGSALAVDDAYNASPESVKEGLGKFKSLIGDKKPLLILGSMLELGIESEKLHRKLAWDIQSLFTNSFNNGTLGVATIGKEAQFIAEELQLLGLNPNLVQVFENTLDAKDLTHQWCEDFEAIYLKGSKSIHLEKLFGAQ